MSIRAKILASALSLPLVAGAALAADTGNRSLVNAAKQGDRAAVQSLLNGPAKEEVVGAQGAAALIAAAARNNGEMTDLLLGAGADPKATNEYGATALYAAASENADPAITKRLLAAGAAEELVRYKVDVNARSKNGVTALMFAARGDANSTRMLLAAGADPNVQIPDWGGTALIIASTMRKLDVVEALLDKGTDPNARDNNSFTALHAAVRDSDYGEDQALRAAAVPIVKVLLKHGADPNARIHQEKPTVRALNEVAFEGATPLALAAEVNNLEAIKVLVAGGADPNIPTAQGTTPLVMATGGATDEQRPRPAEERALAIHTARFLVEHGADVNAAGQFGWTAMHTASYQAFDDVIEYLASKGGKLNTKDELGQTPLSIALSVVTKEAGARRLQIPRRYHKETAQLLLKLGALPLKDSGVNVVLQRNGDLVATEE